MGIDPETLRNWVTRAEVDEGQRPAGAGADGVDHRLYKTELIDRQRSWTDRAAVERETAAWVYWFQH